MENVSGFASMRDGAFVEVVQLELRRLGYTNIEYRVLNAADYGVPQHRKHFILNRKQNRARDSLAEEKNSSNPKGLAITFCDSG